MHKRISKLKVLTISPRLLTGISCSSNCGSYCSKWRDALSNSLGAQHPHPPRAWSDCGNGLEGSRLRTITKSVSGTLVRHLREGSQQGPSRNQMAKRTVSLYAYFSTILCSIYHNKFFNLVFNNFQFLPHLGRSIKNFTRNR